jgi:hypothetical protein
LPQLDVGFEVEGAEGVVEDIDFRFLNQGPAIESRCFWPPEKSCRLGNVKIEGLFVARDEFGRLATSRASHMSLSSAWLLP